MVRELSQFPIVVFLRLNAAAMVESQIINDSSQFPKLVRLKVCGNCCLPRLLSAFPPAFKPAWKQRTLREEPSVVFGSYES